MCQGSNWVTCAAVIIHTGDDGPVKPVCHHFPYGLQLEPQRWKCTCSSWVWTGMVCWGRRPNSSHSWRPRRTPVTLTVCLHGDTCGPKRRLVFSPWLTHCRGVSNSPLWAILPPGLGRRRRRWNQRRRVVSGAAAVLICGAPLQQGSSALTYSTRPHIYSALNSITSFMNESTGMLKEHY